MEKRLFNIQHSTSPLRPSSFILHPSSFIPRPRPLRPSSFILRPSPWEARVPVARSGVLWRRIFILLLAGVSASYIWDYRREYTHGGSQMGIAYGVAGTLLILLLAFFGVRKRWYRSTFGTLEQWMQSHIYLGVLSLVVLIFHSGGRFNDAVAVTTLILVAIVVFSGIFGA